MTPFSLRALARAGAQVERSLRHGDTLSYTVEDRAWDTFLERIPGARHTQTSLWARFKQTSGWRAARVAILRTGQIVAGTQVLVKTMAPGIMIGQVAKGPVVASQDPVLATQIVAALGQLGRACGVAYLIVQPPEDDQVVVAALAQAGFRPSMAGAGLASAMTVRVDLRTEPETLLAAMNAKTRYNIRLGQRKGVVVREGGTDDIGTFHRLLSATGERQGFEPFPERYFRDLWQLLAPCGYVRLALAECEGEVVSAFWYITFGDSVIYKRGAWSSAHGSQHPNEVLHWAGMLWARSQGFHYYDFDGIDEAAGTIILQGGTLPDEYRKTVTSFKLGFGGQVSVLPQTCDYISNPVLRSGYRVVYPRIAHLPILSRLTQHLRHS